MILMTVARSRAIRRTSGINASASGVKSSEFSLKLSIKRGGPGRLRCQSRSEYPADLSLLESQRRARCIVSTADHRGLPGVLQNLSALPVRHRDPADLTLHVRDQDEQTLLRRCAPGKQDKANGPPKSR